MNTPIEQNNTAKTLPPATESSYFDILRKVKPKAKPPQKSKSYYKKLPKPK